MSENNKMTPADKQSSAVAVKKIKPQASKKEIFLRMLKRFFTQFGTAIIAVSIGKLAYFIFISAS